MSKKRSKKACLIKSREFRYHNVCVTTFKGRKKKLRHPAYVFLKQGNTYIYVSITHSKHVDNVFLVKLRKNPNPLDKRESFRTKEIKQDTKDRFGKKNKDWFMDSSDDLEIRQDFDKTKKPIKG